MLLFQQNALSVDSLGLFHIRLAIMSSYRDLRPLISGSITVKLRWMIHAGGELSNEQIETNRCAYNLGICLGTLQRVLHALCILA